MVALVVAFPVGFVVALVVTLAVALVVALAVALAVTLAVTLAALVALVVFVEFARSVRRRPRAVVFAVLFGSLRVVITSFGGLGVGTRAAEQCASRTKDKNVRMLYSRGARRARTLQHERSAVRAVKVAISVEFSLTSSGKQTPKVRCHHNELVKFENTNGATSRTRATYAHSYIIYIAYL